MGQRFLLLLPLLEYLYISLAYDARFLERAPGILAALGKLGSGASLLITTVTAGLLLGGKELKSSLGEAAPRWLIVHVPVFLGFALLTHQGASAAELTGLWVLAWLLCGGLLMLSWLGATGLLGALLGLPRSTMVLTLGVGALAYGAGQLSEKLWEPSAALTLQASARLLGLVRGELVVKPEELLLGLDDFWVVIAPVCSGLEGVGLLFVFLLAYLWIFKDELRLSRALLMLPLALILMWLSNALRIAILVLLGARGHAELALHGFHSKAGWVFFSALALGCAAVTRRWCLKRNEALWPSPQARYLAPLLVVLMTAMLSELIGGALLYPLRVIAGALALLYFWGLDWRIRWDPGRWAAVAAGLGAALLWWLLAPTPAGEPEVQSASALMRGLWLGFRVLGSALIAPIVEELAFRGYLLRRLGGAERGLLPLILSSIAFGVLHSASLAGLVCGVIFGLVWMRRRSDGDAIIAHMTANALLLGQTLGVAF